MTPPRDEKGGIAMKVGRTGYDERVRWTTLLILLFAFDVVAAEVDRAKLPPLAGRSVDFLKEVRPLFERRCYSCHGAEKQKSNYRLDVKAYALKGGDVGRPILPGDS